MTPIGQRGRLHMRQWFLRWGEWLAVAMLRRGAQLLRFVPWRCYRVLGWAVGRLWWWADPDRRRTTVENLQRGFPQRSSLWHRRTARRCYTNSGIVLLELLSLAWLSEEELEERLWFVNPELFAECAARGRGMLLLSAHYGNWEWLACGAGLVLRRLGVPVTVLVKRQNNPVVHEWLNRHRTRWGNRVVELEHAAWAIARAVQRREAIALLADQRAGPEGALWLPFFGVEVPVHAFPAALALRFRVPIILGFPLRQPDGRYRVLLEELPSEEVHDTAEGVRKLTMRYLQRVEAVIRAHPELWLWQHRRWKYARPAHGRPVSA